MNDTKFAQRIIDNLTDAQLEVVWESLNTRGDDGSPYNELTFTEWCELVYSELQIRRAKTKSITTSFKKINEMKPSDFKSYAEWLTWLNQNK